MKEIRKWAENNVFYSLRFPSRRTFKQYKVYGTEIGSLCEAYLPFVQDIAKNDGVKFLLAVNDELYGSDL